MQKSSEVWVVYRTTGGGMDGWYGEPAREVVVSEHSSQQAAEQKARDLDWGKDISASNWHRVKKMTKNVSYY